MSLKLTELKRHAKEYVEIEARTEVLKVKFVKSVTDCSIEKILFYRSTPLTRRNQNGG